MVQHPRSDHEWLEHILRAFKWFPARSNTTAHLSGVDLVAQAAAYMAIQLVTDKYAILTPLRVQGGGSIRLPGSGKRRMAEFIRERLSELQYMRCTSEGDGGSPSE